MKFNRYEIEILRLLQLEGRLPNVEIANRVGLSESPCLRRVKALEAAGVIESYAARLNQRLVGLQLTAFVWVSLEKSSAKESEQFMQRVMQEDYIVECHATSGSYDFLMKVVATSMDHFSDLCMNGILRFPGVSNIESQFSLKALKEGSPLPVSASSSNVASSK